MLNIIESIDGTVCIVTGLICISVIVIYWLSIKKSIHETQRAKEFTEMYKAEKRKIEMERCFMPIVGLPNRTNEEFLEMAKNESQTD